MSIISNLIYDVKFLYSFGNIFGQCKFYYPRCMILDKENNIVVADSGNNLLQIVRHKGLKCDKIYDYWDGGYFRHPTGIAFDGEDKIIVADCNNHRIKIVRYVDGKTIGTFGDKGVNNGEFKYPCSVAVDGNGNVAVYDAFKNNRIQIHRISDGRYLRSIYLLHRKHRNMINSYGCIIFDKEGNIIVSCYNEIQVLRYSDGRYLRNIGSSGYGSKELWNPRGIAFYDFTLLLVSDIKNNCFHIFRYADGIHLQTFGKIGIQSGQFISPYDIIVDRNDNIFVSDTHNHRIQVFDISNYIKIEPKSIISNEAKITKNIHKSFVYSTVYNNDYTKLISTSGDSTLIIWNIINLEKKIIDIKIEKIFTGHKDRVVCVAWKPNSIECASGSNDCFVIVWNTDDGSIIKKYDDHNEIVRSVDYNSEGALASGSDDKTIIIYNKEKIILHHKNRVRSVKWNPVNNNLLLSGCDDFSITLWDVSNKTIIRTFREHTNFIYSLVWKDETKFASSSGDGSIIIWNRDEQKSTKILTGHVGNVWSIDWKEDVLISGGNDKKILIWNTTTYKKEVLTGHIGYVLSVNIDKKDNIISGGTDNMIKVWN